MRYGDIISFGFKNAWKYKSLWILGFLISGGGGSLQFPGRWEEKFGNGRIAELSDQVQRFIEHPAMTFLILAVVVALLFVALIFIVLAIISSGALIDAAKRFKTNQEYRLGLVFKTGAHYFWRILGKGLIFFIVACALILLAVAVGVITFQIETALGIIAILFMIPIAFIVIFLMVQLSLISDRIIVIEDKDIIDSLNEGFGLMKRNWVPNIAYFFINMAIGIGVGIVGFILALIIALPFVAVGFYNLWLALILGIFVLLLVMFPYSGYTGASMHLMSTEFYYQLVAEDLGQSPAYGPSPADTPPAWPSPPPPPQPPLHPDRPMTPPPPPESGFPSHPEDRSKPQAPPDGISGDNRNNPEPPENF